MEPASQTVKLLEELRDGQRSQTEELRELRNEMREGRDRADQHLEIIETSLRDLAEQMVVMTRAVKVALDSRVNNETRLDDHEQRLRALETVAR